MHPALLFVLFALLAASLALWRALNVSKRAEFIRSAPLPKGLYDKLRARRPALSAKDCQLTAQALRQFFLAYLKGGRRTISMPSQVVDDLWHEFILHTRAYEDFCRRAFGGFLHHTPAAVLSNVKRSNEGLRRCWWWACRNDNINPRAPTRLPLLFAIDAKLGIEGGFHYAADCGPLRRAAGDGNVGIVIHCGGDFADASYDGGTEGFGDSSDSSGADSSSTSGDGGSSCGGGCSSD